MSFCVCRVRFIIYYPTRLTSIRFLDCIRFGPFTCVVVVVIQNIVCRARWIIYSILLMFLFCRVCIYSCSASGNNDNDSNGVRLTSPFSYCCCCDSVLLLLPVVVFIILLLFPLFLLLLLVVLLYTTYQRQRQRHGGDSDVRLTVTNRVRYGTTINNKSLSCLSLCVPICQSDSSFASSSNPPFSLPRHRFRRHHLRHRRYHYHYRHQQQQQQQQQQVDDIIRSRRGILSCMWRMSVLPQ